MSLPLFNPSDTQVQLLQTNWSKQLNPLLSAPFSSGLILENIKLAAGSNTINHMLGQMLQGWMITRINGAATIYDQQSTNNIPSKTLVLVSSAPVTVNIFVF